MHAYTHHFMMLAIKCPPDNVEIVQVIKAFVKLPWPHIWLDFTGVFTVKFLEQKKKTHYQTDSLGVLRCCIASTEFAH